MQTQIPRGLQALMQASQVLSSQASPSAPGPQGPQPTVAERVNQQIKQMSRPQAPEGGIMGLPPGLKDIGQQAGIAGKIMAQRQAQQQQMAQDPEAVAQMAAKMVRGQGVDQLPVNMGFKEGGIIGFQGQGRSDVPQATAAPTVEEARKLLAAAVRSRDMNAVRHYQRQLVEAQRREAPPQASPQPVEGPSTTSELMPSLGDTVVTDEAPPQRVAPPQGASTASELMPSLSDTSAINAGPPPEGRARPSGIRQMSEEEVARLRQDPLALQQGKGIVQMTPEQIAKLRADPYALNQPSQAGNRPSGTRPQGNAQPPARPTAQPPVVPPTAAAPTAAPAEPTIDTSGVKPIDITKGIDQLAPSRAKGQIERLQKLEDERATTKASLFDEFDAGIKALEKDKEVRKQLLKSKEERDNFNRMMAFFQDLRTKGNQYGSVDDAIFARNEAERLADLAHDKAVIELRRAKKADQLGDIDRKIAFEDKATGLFKAEDALRVQAAQVTGGAERDRFTQEMQSARTAAEIKAANSRNEAQIAQLDRRLAADLQMSRERYAEARQQRLSDAESRAMTAALGRLNDAAKTLATLKAEKGNAVALGETSKSPEAQRMAQEARSAIKVAEDAHADAKRVFDALADKALGINRAAPAGGANRADPLNIRGTK